MGPAMYLLAIMGCGEGEAPCEQVRVADTRYETQAACMAATEAAVMRSQDLPFPVVVAQCRAAGEAPARLSPADVRLPEPEANPHFPIRRS